MCRTTSAQESPKGRSYKQQQQELASEVFGEEEEDGEVQDGVCKGQAQREQEEEEEQQQQLTSQPRGTTQEQLGAVSSMDQQEVREGTDILAFACALLWSFLGRALLATELLHTFACSSDTFAMLELHCYGIS
jgi:hypothetical protein